MLIEALADAVSRHAQDPGFFREPGSRLAGLVLELSRGEAAETEQRRLAEMFSPQRASFVGSEARLLQGSNDFRNRRVAVVAQWSENGVLAPYVIHYLRKLRELGFDVVLACGNQPRPASEWTGLCAAVVCRTCSGYDFTTWKAAFEVLPGLYEAREVLCTNDSVFGPVHPLGPVHAVMDAVPCDFWGLVESREKIPHLQSYYLLFRESALRHPAFPAFWGAVDCCADKFNTVLRYEVTLSEWLALQGLVPGAYVPAAALPVTNANPAHYFWRQLLVLYRTPFLKRDLLRRCGQHPFLAGWDTILADCGYDPGLTGC